MLPGKPDCWPKWEFGDNAARRRSGARQEPFEHVCDGCLHHGLAYECCKAPLRSQLLQGCRFPTRDENRRLAGALRPEGGQELCAIRSIKLQIDDEAVIVSQIQIGQELGATPIFANIKSARAKQNPQRPANRFAIVHDGDPPITQDREGQSHDDLPEKLKVQTRATSPAASLGTSPRTLRSFRNPPQTRF